MTTTDSAERSPDELTDDRPAAEVAAGLDAAPEVVIEVTARAVEKVLEIRSAEPDPETLGLRVEVTGSVGVDYQYDLSLEPLTDAEAGDSVVERDGLAIIVPADSIDKLRGATLDLPSAAG